jgi:resuscitation-promoting factor RpfB
MAGKGISGVAVGLTAAGGVLIYSGIYNRSVGDILGSIARGQRPTAGPPETFEASGSSGGGTAGAPVPPAPSASAAANQAIARLLAAPHGWSAGPQWDALVDTWNRESGWSNTAWNPSGAYGIAQALGHAQSGEAEVGPRSSGSDTPGLNASYGGYGLSAAQAQSANAGHATDQITWGLHYILATYTDPAGAWAHEQSAGWY